jgi:3,4-dihydroxy 2-butanone 4-phosphate synthase
MIALAEESLLTFLVLAGVTTGISAHDRALTARKLADPSVKGSQFNRPGHLVPLRARPNGVLERRGHTEAAIGQCYSPVPRYFD